MSSRGKSRLVDETHITDAEDYSDQVHVTSQTSIKETCADTLSIFPSQASFYTKEPFLRPRGSGKPILCMEELCQWRSPRWLQKWYVITIKMNDSLTHHFIGKALAKHGARDFSDEHVFDLFMKKAARQDSSTARIHQIPWLTFEQFNDTLVEYQLTLSWWVHSNSLQLEKVFFSQGLFFQRPIYPWERTDSGWKGKRQRTADYLLHITWPFVVETPMKKNPVMITQFLKKCTVTVTGNVMRMPFMESHVTCDHCSRSSCTICASRAHQQSNLSLRTEIEYCSKDSQPHDPRQKSHLAIAATATAAIVYVCDDVSTSFRKLVTD